MHTIKIESSIIKGLGLHYDAQSWTLADLANILDLMGSGCEVIEDLMGFCHKLGIPPNEPVLTCYESKTDRQVYFTTPRVQLSRSGELSLIVGNDLVFPLAFKGSSCYTVDHYTNAEDETKYITEPVTFEVNNVFNESKQLISINFELHFALEVDGLMQKACFSVRLMTKRDANKLEIAKAVAKGEPLNSDQISQAGKGGGFAVSYKPYMLPTGFYRIAEVLPIKFLENGGKIVEGYVEALDDETGKLYRVRMTSAPFMTAKNDALIVAAQNTPSTNKGVYVYIGGARITPMGNSAIGHAVLLPQDADGNPLAKAYAQFRAECNVIVTAQKVKNASSLVPAAQIEADRAAFEAEQLEKFENWKSDKEGGKTDAAVAVRAEVVSDTTTTAVDTPEDLAMVPTSRSEVRERVAALAQNPKMF